MKVNHSVEEDGASYEMATAIVLHKKDDAGKWQSEGSGILSIHPIYHNKHDNPVIGPGKLCDRQALENVLRDLAGHDTKYREILPAKLLFSDSSQLLWYCPSHREVIYFSTADSQFNTDVTGKEVTHPTLVFQATHNRLAVFALPNSERPNDKSPLYTAPYCNLYSAGNMCQGDVKYPNSLLPAAIGQWERIFFDSRFTHSNLHGAQMTAFEGGHNVLWRELVKREEFPVESLVKTKWTLEQLLNFQIKP